MKNKVEYVVIKGKDGKPLSEGFCRSNDSSRNGTKVRNTLLAYILKEKGYGYAAIQNFLGVSQRTMYRYRKEISTVEAKTKKIQTINQ